MSEERKLGLSRREFLKDAGLVVGGATLGSMAFMNASCTHKETNPPKYICPVDGSEWPSEEAFKVHFATAHPFADAPNLVRLDINGTSTSLQVGDMELLSTTLRDKLGLFGLKVGCDMGVCGACTVLVDDVAVFSCLTLTIECLGKKITTIEGLSDGFVLSNVQQRFYAQDAFQCGYCTPGFIMAGQGLLLKNSRPSFDEARLAVSGHACTCGNIKKVVDALTGDGMIDPIAQELGGI